MRKRTRTSLYNQVIDVSLSRTPPPPQTLLLHSVIDNYTTKRLPYWTCDRDDELARTNRKSKNASFCWGMLGGGGGVISKQSLLPLTTLYVSSLSFYHLVASCFGVNLLPPLIRKSIPIMGDPKHAHVFTTHLKREFFRPSQARGDGRRLCSMG